MVIPTGCSFFNVKELPERLSNNILISVNTKGYSIMANSSNDIIEVIKTRRCIREYLDKEISDTDIKFLIECAGYAPSGLNMQPWAFLVIRTRIRSCSYRKHARSP